MNSAVADAPISPTALRAALDAAYRRHRARKWIVIVIGVAVLIAVMLTATALGIEVFDLSQTLRALLWPLLPQTYYPDLSSTQIDILRNLRLPRTLMTVIAGAGLSIAGAALQGLTRNPLVSPATLGISWASAFGASVAILLNLGETTGLGSFVVIASAFVSAAICTSIILSLSTLRGTSMTVLILVGIGLNYFFNALTQTAQYAATDQQLSAIVRWTFGTVEGSTWDEVWVTGGILLVTAPILIAHAWPLNAFAAGGEDIAHSLGFAVSRTRFIVTVAAVLVIASITSFVGVISFIGLIAPHIARLLVGSDHRVLLPFSAILGATLLLIADMVGRLAFSPVIIPVGIVEAYIGVPIFLHLLLSRPRELAI